MNRYGCSYNIETLLNLYCMHAKTGLSHLYQDSADNWLFGNKCRPNVLFAFKELTHRFLIRIV